MASATLNFDPCFFPAPLRRRCAHPGCPTLLSRSNYGDVCRTHRDTVRRIHLLEDANLAQLAIEPRICAVEGCPEILGPNNRKGRCAQHAYITMGMRLKDGTELKPLLPRIGCSVAGCTRTLHFNNRTGICLFHKELRRRTAPAMIAGERLVAALFAKWQTEPIGKERVQ
jgi:hypothetical protein